MTQDRLSKLVAHETADAAYWARVASSDEYQNSPFGRSGVNTAAELAAYHRDVAAALGALCDFLYPKAAA